MSSQICMTFFIMFRKEYILKKIEFTVWNWKQTNKQTNICI